MQDFRLLYFQPIAVPQLAAFSVEMSRQWCRRHVTVGPSGDAVWQCIPGRCAGDDATGAHLGRCGVPTESHWALCVPRGLGVTHPIGHGDVSVLMAISPRPRLCVERLGSDDSLWPLTGL